MPVGQLHLRHLMMDGCGHHQSEDAAKQSRAHPQSSPQHRQQHDAEALHQRPPRPAGPPIGSEATSVLLPRASISLAFNIFLHLPGAAHAAEARPALE